MPPLQLPQSIWSRRSLWLSWLWAMLDPNPVVSGRGQDELLKAGIKTSLGEHEEEAREVNEAYIKFITTGIPFVTVKFAVSLAFFTLWGELLELSGPYKPD